MTELTNKSAYLLNSGLLCSVSAVALLVAWSGAASADSQDEKPTVWIEVGGSLNRIEGQGDNFPIGFLEANSNSDVLKSPSPYQAQNASAFVVDENGKISFQPKGSDWNISVAVKYGRSNSHKEADHQTNNLFYTLYKSGAVKYNIPPENPRGIDRFADTQTTRSQSHSVVDFSVGKDVGLGLFGGHASSTINVGVRYAQFSSRMKFDVRARPDIHFKYQSIPTYNVLLKFPYFHTYHASGQSVRNFHGIGPSVSWSGSAPIVGEQADSEIALDWGANASLLFGRQIAHVKHLASAHYVTPQFVLQGGYHTAYPAKVGGHDTDRSLIVPNVGGSVGLSYRYSNAKVSFGYQADFFFGAIDGGINSQKSKTVGFFGPFANVSIGLGG